MFNNNHQSHTGQYHSWSLQTSEPSQSLQLKPVMSENKVSTWRCFHATFLTAWMSIGTAEALCKDHHVIRMTPTVPDHHTNKSTHKDESPQQPPSPLVHTSPNEIHDNSHDVIHMTAKLRVFFWGFFPPIWDRGSPSPQPAGVTETWGSSGGGVMAWVMASLVNAAPMTFVWITELIVKHLHCRRFMVSL